MTKTLHRKCLLCLIVFVAIIASCSGSDQRHDSLPTVTVDPKWSSTRQVEGTWYLLAYPSPNAVLTLNEYEQGIQRPGTINRDVPAITHNICLYIELIDWPRLDWSSSNQNTDIPDEVFWNNVEVWLDGQEINSADLPFVDGFEIPGFLSDTFFLCYDVALEVGRHQMRYVFRWEAEDFVDEGEWEFTIIDSE